MQWVRCERVSWAVRSINLFDGCRVVFPAKAWTQLNDFIMRMHAGWATVLCWSNWAPQSWSSCESGSATARCLPCAIMLFPEKWRWGPLGSSCVALTAFPLVWLKMAIWGSLRFDCVVCQRTGHEDLDKVSCTCRYFKASKVTFKRTLTLRRGACI